jgi:hypothetical protein
MIVVEIVRGGHAIHHRKPCTRAFHHRDCYGAVQGHNRGRLHALQSIVEPDDLGPVRVRGLRGFAMLGGYFLIDAKDLDEAIGIAERIPAGRWGTVEIRPVMEIPGLPSS